MGKKSASASVSSPLPYVSPSRSTDDGDDRPPPLSSATPPAPLQQPNLSPRFRSANLYCSDGAAVVSPNRHSHRHGHNGSRAHASSDRSVASLVQPHRRSGSPLLLIDDRSVASESDLILKPCASIDSIEEHRLRLHLQHGVSVTMPTTPGAAAAGADLVVDWRNLARSPAVGAGTGSGSSGKTVQSLAIRLPTADLRPRPSSAPRASNKLPPDSPSILTGGEGGRSVGEGGGGEDDCEGADDDVSSLGDQDDPLLIPSPPPLPRGHSRSSLNRLARAILRGSDACPAGLGRDETMVWEAVQAVLGQKGDKASRPSSPLTPSALRGDYGDAKDENVSNNHGSEAAQATSEEKGAPLQGLSGKDRLREFQERIHSQERNHQSSMLDMQRILAEVTKERDEMRKQLLLRQASDRSISSLQSPPTTPTNNGGGEEDGDAAPGGERAIRALEAELTRRNCRIRELERELSQHSNLCLTPAGTASSVSTTSPTSRHEDETKNQENVLAVPGHQLTPTRSLGDESFSAATDDAVQLSMLKGVLKDKMAALENAKMIIASLEIASGSLAADMRAKVKSKDDELAAIKVELGEKQRALDCLATQLREVQRSQSYARYNQLRSEERSRRLGLSSRLEKNMADFRAALVVLESTTQDSTSLELVSNLLSDTVLAMKDGIDVLDEDLDADESTASGYGDTSSSNSGASLSRCAAVPSAEARKLRQELDEKARAIHRLEEALRREQEERAQLRAERDAGDSKRQEELEAMRVEVQVLKEQCYTNMEVLAKKERELVVLRDSLKVDDGVGYISDDGSDATESDVNESPASPVPPIFKYGASQAEAFATLLAQSSAVSGNKNSLSAEAANELQGLKQELHQARNELERYRKQLKTEKESLVNAKMIISSLEKANKSIMDDLRARLQDSNTAITSLLEKSIENEKATSRLRDEVDIMRKEKERYEAEIATLRPGYLGESQLALRGLICPLEEKKDDKPETID